MMAHELLVGYERSSRPYRCSFEIAIQKACDSIDWGFFLRSVGGYGFSSNYAPFTEVVTKTSYSVMVNGKMDGFLRLLEVSVKDALFHLICLRWLWKALLVYLIER